jgi:hypothetical protein
MVSPGFAMGKGPPGSIVQEARWVSEPVRTQRLEEKSFAPIIKQIKILILIFVSLLHFSMKRVFKYYYRFYCRS